MVSRVAARVPDRFGEPERCGCGRDRGDRGAAAVQDTRCDQASDRIRTRRRGDPRPPPGRCATPTPRCTARTRARAAHHLRHSMHDRSRADRLATPCAPPSRGQGGGTSPSCRGHGSRGAERWSAGINPAGSIADDLHHDREDAGMPARSAPGPRQRAQRGRGERRDRATTLLSIKVCASAARPELPADGGSRVLRSGAAAASPGDERVGDVDAQAPRSYSSARDGSALLSRSAPAFGPGLHEQVRYGVKVDVVRGRAGASRDEEIVARGAIVRLGGDRGRGVETGQATALAAMGVTQGRPAVGACVTRWFAGRARGGSRGERPRPVCGGVEISAPPAREQGSNH